MNIYTKSFLILLGGLALSLPTAFAVWYGINYSKQSISVQSSQDQVSKQLQEVKQTFVSKETVKEIASDLLTEDRAKLTQALTQLASVNAKQGENDAKMIALLGQMAEVFTKLEQTKGEVSLKQSEVKTIVDTTKSEIDKTKLEIDKQKNDLTNANTQIGNIQNSVNNTTASLQNQLNSNVNTLNTALLSASSSIALLKAEGIPVGSVTCFYGQAYNIPLPANWKYLDGTNQIFTLADGTLLPQTLPDINGQEKYLIANTTAGLIVNQSTAMPVGFGLSTSLSTDGNHTHTTLVENQSGSYGAGTNNTGSGANYFYANPSSNNYIGDAGSHTHTANTTSSGWDSLTRPNSITCPLIIKIK